MTVQQGRSDRRCAQQRDLTRRADEAGRDGQFGPVDQGGQRTEVGGVEPHVDGGDAERDDEHLRHAEKVKGGRGRDGGQQERGDGVAADHDLLPVHAVGHRAGEQPEATVGRFEPHTIKTSAPRNSPYTGK